MLEILQIHVRISKTLFLYSLKASSKKSKLLLFMHKNSQGNLSS